MANNGATEEVFMSRSELLDELNLQQGMLSSLEPDTEDYDLSKAVLEQEISRLKARLQVLKQKKQQQNANVTLRGPFLAAASSSSKPARNPASSSATSNSSNPTSFGNPSASKDKFSDPFAGKQPFRLRQPSASSLSGFFYSLYIPLNSSTSLFFSIFTTYNYHTSFRSSIYSLLSTTSLSLGLTPTSLQIPSRQTSHHPAWIHSLTLVATTLQHNRTCRAPSSRLSFLTAPSATA